MTSPKLILAAVAFTALAACGDTIGEQALAGGAVGAGAAAVINTNLAAGAAIGAAGNIIYCQENPAAC